MIDSIVPQVRPQRAKFTVLGGFHLSGPLFEAVIAPTVEAMQRIRPEYVVPMHCTGCNAIARFAEEMPDQFLRNAVGTTYVFE